MSEIKNIGLTQSSNNYPGVLVLPVLPDACTPYTKNHGVRLRFKP